MPTESFWRRLLLASTLVAAVVGGPLAASPSPSAAPSAAPTPSPTASAAAAPGPYRGYFNWFDNASPGMTNDNIHIVNPGSAATNGTVTLGSSSLPFSLAPGAEAYVTFAAGTISGPVRVDAAAPVIAAQRVTYYRSMSEVPAMDQTSATVDAWWPWYDNASPGMLADNIHLLNTDPSLNANVTLRLGTMSVVVTVHPGQETYYAFPAGSIGGPVHLTSDHPVLAAQRVATLTSFNELPALSTTAAATALLSSWYDLASPGFTADNIHLVDASPTAAHVTFWFGTTNEGTFTIAAASEFHIAFPVGTIGGPIKLTSDQPVLATQRISYYDSFQEVRFKGAGEAATDLWFNWYDDASPCFLADNIHLTNPTPGTVTGTATLAGQPTLSFSINPGQEAILNWPRGTIGGPVHVSASTGGVLADKRVVICPPPPPPPPPVRHRIVVSLSQQHLWAYDGSNLLLETDVTTGRPELPTPAGTYHIFYKTSPYQMISPWPYGSPYWYPSAWVNWVLEFIQGGYFLHDAPWRSWFGPGSQYGDGTHGCVNIPDGPMQQLYGWAQLGDEVDVNN